MDHQNILLHSTLSQGSGADPAAPFLAPPLPTSSAAATTASHQFASDGQPMKNCVVGSGYDTATDETASSLIASPSVFKNCPTVYPVLIPPISAATLPPLEFSHISLMSPLYAHQTNNSQLPTQSVYNQATNRVPLTNSDQFGQSVSQNSLLQSTCNKPAGFPLLKPLDLATSSLGTTCTDDELTPKSEMNNDSATSVISTSSNIPPPPPTHASNNTPAMFLPVDYSQQQAFHSVPFQPICSLATVISTPSSPTIDAVSSTPSSFAPVNNSVSSLPGSSTPSAIPFVNSTVISMTVSEDNTLQPFSLGSSSRPTSFTVPTQTVSETVVATANTFLPQPSTVPLSIPLEHLTPAMDVGKLSPKNPTDSMASSMPQKRTQPPHSQTFGSLHMDGLTPSTALTTQVPASSGSGWVGLHHPRPTLCYTRILLGEITPLLAAMRRAAPRWSQHQTEGVQDPLVAKLRELQVHVTSLSTRSGAAPPPPAVYLEPFLAVIRSDDTTGPVTKTALASVNRMLSYGLVSSDSPGAAASVEDIATAVTHARFVGTDQGADEVVLWEILAVLQTLLLGPAGYLLTNESVCELLNSSFRICFETRLSELLRNCTEDALRQMVGLLFARLPQFADDPHTANAKRLKMKAGSDSGKSGKKSKTSKLLQRSHSPTPSQHVSSGTSSKGGHSNTSSEASKPKSPTPPENSFSLRPESPISVETDKENKEQNQISGSKEQQMQINCDAASIDSGITDPSLQDPSSVDISSAHLTLAHSGSLESLQSPVSDTDHSALSSPAAETTDTQFQGNDVCNGGESSRAENISPPTSGSEHDTAAASSSTADASESNSAAVSSEPFVNTQGVKFTQDSSGDGGLVPYGMACVREVLRFLVSLTSPTNDQNTPTMIATALGLITVALEVGGEHINKCPSLLHLVRDPLCRNLLLLLKPETRPTILMASLRVCVLIFESLRTHVKFQLEMFMMKLTEIITSEAANVSYSHKELALETVVQLWRIPGLITELFVNFDCDLYSDNIFEDLTKILSKNAFPVQGLYSTNLLSLDALLAVIDTLDSHSISQQKLSLSKPKVDDPPASIMSQPNTLAGPPMVVASPASGYLLGVGLLSGFSPVTPILKPFTTLRNDEQPLREHLLALKEKKRLLATGTDQFNVKPEKGIQFLQDNGILGTTTQDIAVFMKENPKLCKKMIGEYLSKKKNVGILSAFVKSFEFARLRIDQCLRTFLETFRLPGEAPLISIIIEHFSSHYHLSNNEPFGKEDAAFTLAYAVIMLNVDQHNQNAKKQNIPMTVDQFRNNLRGVNDGKDFDKEMLEDVYNAICSEEIIMPAEQTGLVKENYMWKMLLKRGGTKEGKYMLSNEDHSFDRDLFAICWGPTVASLSYVFDKSTDDAFIQKSLSGFKKCASISARYGMSDVFDNLVVSLCKFTGLTSTMSSADSIAIEFGSNAKAQLAAKTLFRLVTLHGDILRDGWKNVVEVLLQLFRSRLLPLDLTQSPDLIEGCVSLYRPNNVAQPRVEPSLLSSLYSYIALGDGGARGATPEDEECRERAKQCVVECHIEKLICESAFLRLDALSDMLKAIMTIGDGSCLVAGARAGGAGGATDGSTGDGESLDEYGHALLLEIVVQVIIANKDRAVMVWGRVQDYVLSLMMTCAAASRPAEGGGKGAASAVQGSTQGSAAGGNGLALPPPTGESAWLLGRCVSSLLRLAAVLVRRLDMSSLLLQSLRMFFLLSPHVLAAVSLQVVAGVHELLTLTADHITHTEDWAVVFALLESAGAGARPPPALLPHPHPLLHMRSLPESELGSSSGPDSGHCSEAGSGSEAAPSGGRGRGRASRATSPDGSAVGGWIMVGTESSEAAPAAPHPYSGPPSNQWDIVQQREFWPGPHPAPDAVVRAVDTLAFLVRERHMTSASLPCAVQTARTFVEATLHGGRAELQHQQQRNRAEGIKSPQRRRLGGRKRGDDQRSGGSSSGGGVSGGLVRKGGSSKHGTGGALGGSAYDADESDSDDVPATFQQLSEKLLDLLDTLHTSAGSVMVRAEASATTTAPRPHDQPDLDSTDLVTSEDTTACALDLAGASLAAALSNGADLSSPDDERGPPPLAAPPLVEEGDESRSTPLDFSSGSLLWQEVLCPLLQGIARYCCDRRPRIRHLAMTYLQRALLNHDLQTLDANQWEACFNKVLFPLLSALLPAGSVSQGGQPPHSGPAGSEETRLRAATLVQKVYLRHLTTLLTLPTFTALWLTILDYLDKYLNINTTDHLSDAVPEILKNMLLVMETTQVFHTAHGFTRLWSVTWDRVDSFLPGFRTELFKSHPPSKIHRIEVVPDQPTESSQQPEQLLTAPHLHSPPHEIFESLPTTEVESHQPLETPCPPPHGDSSSVAPPPLSAAPNEVSGASPHPALNYPGQSDFLASSSLSFSNVSSSTAPHSFSSPSIELPVSAGSNVSASVSSTFPVSRSASNSSFCSSGVLSYPLLGTGAGPQEPMSDDETRLSSGPPGGGVGDLDEPAAARLSLSHECLPIHTGGVVLHRPLPLPPPPASLPTHGLPVTLILPHHLHLHQQAGPIPLQHQYSQCEQEDPQLQAHQAVGVALPQQHDYQASEYPYRINSHETHVPASFLPLFQPSDPSPPPEHRSWVAPQFSLTAPPVLVQPLCSGSISDLGALSSQATDATQEREDVSCAKVASHPTSASHLFRSAPSQDDPFSRLPQSGV